MPEYFGKESFYERSDSLYALLNLHNLSKFIIRNNSKTKFMKLKPLDLPSHLVRLKETPLQNFLHETSAYYKPIDIDDDQTGYNWTLVTMAIIVAFFIVVIIILLRLRTNKCYCRNKINGRQFANVHDLEGGEAKLSPPSSGEDIELSIIANPRDVSNESESGLSSFRRTDAMLAWRQN